MAELRIDVGPGYRVYYGSVDQTIVVLLIAGTKGTQEHDIVRAKTYWQEFQHRYGNND